jgi:hypothetical protein
MAAHRKSDRRRDDLCPDFVSVLWTSHYSGQRLAAALG